MAVPSSGTLNISALAAEKLENDYTDVDTSYGPYSLKDITLGGATTVNGEDYDATNTNSANKPDSIAPHAMSEWYGYDHDASGSTGKCLLIIDSTFLTPGTQTIEYSARLEEQSKELTKAAAELRIANNKLTELSTQKDEFLSHVSHELRTPMTSIRSFSEILQSNKKLDKDQLKYFSTIINDESKRLTRLLDEILDLSFLESGQVKLNISTLRLNEILRTALQSTQQTIANSNALLEFNEDFTNTEIQTDPDRLSQVFINLITNAFKYNDNNQPTLKISCEIKGAFLLVSFQDNGPGIPKAEHTIIFEKFTRLSNTENTSGVGLGLAISQEIMKNLRGSISCLESKIGANFQVQIPLRLILIQKNYMS